MRALASILVVAALTAADPGPLGALPTLARPQAEHAATPPFDPLTGIALGPGVRTVPGERVVLDGSFQIDKGPADGLEVLACLRDGKTHEALIRLTSTDGSAVKAAIIAAFGLADGKPAEEARGIPARGVPLRLTLLWRDEDGNWAWADAASLVRDRPTDRAFPPLPWIYTGSRIVLITENGPEGKPVRRERFMLDSTRSVAVNYDEPDALLASPFPSASEDARFETNSSICPPASTAVHLIISPASEVLGVRLDASGALSRGGTTLDDAALSAALRQAFAGIPVHRALTVHVAGGVGDETVVAARARILAAATAATVWAVPVFQPE
jgi:hypothetical protein